MVAATKDAGCRLQQFSDETLMELVALQNDHAAFAELYRRFERRVFWCCLKRVGDWQRAEDVTAEVFASLFARRSRYCPGGTFARWLFGIARRVTLQHRHGRSHRRWAELAVEPAVAPRDAEDDRREEARAYQLRVSIERLRPIQAAAVTAVCLNGDSQSAFARLSGRTSAAVADSIWYGMRNLHADKALAAIV